MTTDDLLDLVRADFRRDKRFIEGAYRWACRGLVVAPLAGCPSEPPPHPILVDQSADVPDYCADYCARAVDTGLQSGVECECSATVPIITEDRP